MSDSLSDRPASTAALLRTWLKFFLILVLITWLLRLASGAVMVPDALWPRAWWWGLRFDLAVAAFLAGLTVIGLWLVSRSPLPVPRRGWLIPAGVVLLGATWGTGSTGRKPAGISATKRPSCSTRSTAF